MSPAATEQEVADAARTGGRGRCTNRVHLLVRRWAGIAGPEVRAVPGQNGAREASTGAMKAARMASASTDTRVILMPLGSWSSEPAGMIA